MRTTRPLLLAAVALLAACADSPTAPPRTTIADVAFNQSEGRGVFQRYVALGTSISMGWASDGVYIESQEASWPAQLGRLGHREITQPYIASPGCRSPLIAPLGLAVRLSGESALANPATLSCAPLVAGVTLPTQNVAVNGARTADALLSTPENTTDPLYDRVLPPGATQVSAMEAQNPKLVSVELGAVEVLSARFGVAIAGPPPAPILAPSLWAPLYDQVLDRVEASTAKHVVLVGLITNPSSIPAFRFGSEIAANAAVLLVGFNVAVQPDCATTNSGNLIFIMPLLPTVMLQGLAARAQSLPPVPFTCAAGGPTTPDFVLTPGEQTVVAGVLAQMNAIIQAEAASRGWAYFSLDALYAAPGVRPPLNVATLLTSATPFGPFMSLDGLHPSAAGQALIAAAAAQALNQTYDLGIPIDTP
jgi:hypothetical protein